MTTRSQIRLTNIFADEGYAKVFIVVGEDTRKCLICGQLFTRQESYEHSKVACYPWTRSC